MVEKELNDLKVLEFQVNRAYPDGQITRGHYGINVLKVQRIINMPETVIQVPSSHPAIMGIITIQGVSIPVIDLTKSLSREVPDSPPSKVIITEFCEKLHGFAVHSVERIHNLDWKDVEHPPDLVNSSEVYTIGVVKLGEKVALLLDFEKIVSDINPELGVKEEEIEDDKPDRSKKHILIAEDSTFIRTAIKQTLAKAGYNVAVAEDGQVAFNMLEEYLVQTNSGDKTLTDFVDLVVADLEMPQMDGRELTSNIKKSPYMQHLPVIIFSSLINEDYETKARELGVEAVIGKPKIKELVSLVDKLLLK